MWIIPKTNLVCGGFCRKAGKLVGVQLLLEFLVLLIVDVRYTTVCHVRHIYTYTLRYTTTGGLPLSPTPLPIFSYFPRPQSSTGTKIQMSPNPNVRNVPPSHPERCVTMLKTAARETSCL